MKAGMDHVVYLDAKTHELEKLLAGEKSMIVRGAAGRKLPYGRVNAGDRLFFIRNNGDGLVCASARVCEAFSSEKLTSDQSSDLLKANQWKLALTPEQIKRWAGKRYLVLIEVENLREVGPFSIDRSEYGNMDDWLLVEKIERVRK